MCFRLLFALVLLGCGSDSQSATAALVGDTCAERYETCLAGVELRSQWRRCVDALQDCTTSATIEGASCTLDTSDTHVACAEAQGAGRAASGPEGQVRCTCERGERRGDCVQDTVACGLEASCCGEVLR